MIERYTRPEMGAVWTQQAKFQSWLDVELAATDAWAAEGVVPAEAAAICREKAAFTVEEINAREEITNHDVADARCDIRVCPPKFTNSYVGYLSSPKLGASQQTGRSKVPVKQRRECRVAAHNHTGIARPNGERLQREPPRRWHR